MKRILIYIDIILLVFSFSCDNEKSSPKESIAGNIVKAIYIDENDIKWFGTENGISSFDGEYWKTYTTEDKLAGNSVNDIAFQLSHYGPEIWIATDAGASVFAVELDAVTAATSYTSSNSGLAGDSVWAVALDTADNRWFGTNAGVSVFAGQVWDAADNGGTLINNPINDIDSDPEGYSFITTHGAGVAVMRYVDAISTVTYYEQPWSPLPSMNVLSVYVDKYGQQWYGTDNGVAFHIGLEAKQNWYLFSEDDGLINNLVISIKGDETGNAWFGTPAGVSKFDGQNWTNYTTQDGLAGNTVYAIAIDINGTLWFGTDNGVSSFDGITWTTYRKD